MWPSPASTAATPCTVVPLLRIEAPHAEDKADEDGAAKHRQQENKHA